MNDFITGLSFGGGFAHVHSTFCSFQILRSRLKKCYQKQSGFPPGELNQPLYQKELSHKVKYICSKWEATWNHFQSHDVPEQREAGTFYFGWGMNIQKEEVRWGASLAAERLSSHGPLWQHRVCQFGSLVETCALLAELCCVRHPTCKVEEDGHGCWLGANLAQQKEEDCGRY